MKLKKTGLALMSLILMLTMIPAMSSAASKLPLRVDLNGERIVFPDAQPYVDKNNRVQVPVRFVSEALGAKVGWNSKAQKVTINLDSNQIVLTLGKKAYTVNSETKQMDTVALRKANRTFVPLRFVSEALGAQVKWDSSNYMVEITTGSGSGSLTTGDGTNDTKIPTSWEEWEASRNVEGKSDKLKVEGFSFNNVYNSGLGVDGSDYDPKTKKGALLQIILVYGSIYADVDQQEKDLEALLSQRVDQKTVDSVMNYVRKKKNREDELLEKTFTDDTFKVVVESQTYNDIHLVVWYK